MKKDDVALKMSVLRGNLMSHDEGTVGSKPHTAEKMISSK